MATISITFLGAMISFIMTLVMYQWAMGYLDMRVPYDIDIRNNYSTNFLGSFTSMTRGLFFIKQTLII